MRYASCAGMTTNLSVPISEPPLPPVIDIPPDGTADPTPERGPIPLPTPTPFPLPLPERGPEPRPDTFSRAA
jgi:hypothetical protein